MSIPLNVFLTETDVCFPRRSHNIELISYCKFLLMHEIPFPFFYDVILIDKTNLHAVRHFIEFTQNSRSSLVLMRTSRKIDFRSRDIAKNNFSGIAISQDLDLEPPSLSPYILLYNCMNSRDFPCEHTHVAIAKTCTSMKARDVKNENYDQMK